MLQWLGFGAFSVVMFVVYVLMWSGILKTSGAKAKVRNHGQSIIALFAALGPIIADRLFLGGAILGQSYGQSAMVAFTIGLFIYIIAGLSIGVTITCNRSRKAYLAEQAQQSPTQLSRQ